MHGTGADQCLRHVESTYRYLRGACTRYLRGACTRLVQTACGRRNGFEYTVQMHMEASSMRLVLGHNDAATVNGVVNEHLRPFRRARFNWVTEPGSKEKRLAASCGEYVASWNWR